MSRFKEPKEAVAEAIRVLGGQTALAIAAGPDVKLGNVYYWLNKANEVPAEFSIGIYGATLAKGEPVFCEELCPSVNWDKARSTKGPEDVGPLIPKAEPLVAADEHPMNRQPRRSSKYAKRNEEAVARLKEELRDERSQSKSPRETRG